MWEAIGLSVLTLVSILIGYGMGKDKSNPPQYVQNIYAPEPIDTTVVYRQTKNLIDGKDVGE